MFVKWIRRSPARLSLNCHARQQITMGKPSFAVREKLCRAFFYRAHGKGILCRAFSLRRTAHIYARLLLCLPCVFWPTHGKHLCLPCVLRPAHDNRCSLTVASSHRCRRYPLPCATLKRTTKTQSLSCVLSRHTANIYLCHVFCANARQRIFEK
jgi:hypothetical protein